LFGYIGGLNDHHKLTTPLLLNGEKASVRQKHLLVEIANAQQLDAMVEISGEQQSLADPLTVAASVLPK